MSQKSIGTLHNYIFVKERYNFIKYCWIGWSLKGVRFVIQHLGRAPHLEAITGVVKIAVLHHIQYTFIHIFNSVSPLFQLFILPFIYFAAYSFLFLSFSNPLPAIHSFIPYTFQFCCSSFPAVRYSIQFRFQRCCSSFSPAIHSSVLYHFNSFVTLSQLFFLPFILMLIFL